MILAPAMCLLSADLARFPLCILWFIFILFISNLVDERKHADYPFIAVTFQLNFLRMGLFFVGSW